MARSWYQRDGSVTYVANDVVEILNYATGQWTTATVIQKGRIGDETAYQVRLPNGRLKGVRLSDIRRKNVQPSQLASR